MSAVETTTAKPSLWRRMRPDGFLLVIIGAVVLASLLPVQGGAATAYGAATDIAIALLFFLHGARLSREAIIGGMVAWRIHVGVLAATFGLFPLMGLAVWFAARGVAAPAIVDGTLLMTLMPSTVQSSIAFTGVARGNVPAAVCAAALSNLLGIFLTPLLVTLAFAHSGGGISWDGAIKIVLQLLVPFALGHFARPWIGAMLSAHKSIVTLFDRAVIVLVVYGAFSAAVSHGLWQSYAIGDLVWMMAFIVVILGIALTMTTYGARLLGFGKEDEIAIVFCGSKKSMASGIPIASALFPPAVLGPIIIPLMLYHQVQLIACTWLSQRYAARD